MPQPPINKLFFTLSPEQENEIANRVIDDMLVEIQQDIENAFPDDMLPTMVELPDEQRAERYAMVTQPQDVELLKDEDYLTKLDQGLASIPVSPFWRNAVIFPDIFRELQKDYNKVTS